VCENARYSPLEDGPLIRYRLRLLDLNRHHFEVECSIDNPAPEQTFSLPSWIPGSYLLREYARHVVQIEATSGPRAVAVEKCGKASWVCRGAERQLTVVATVYALDESVRGAYLDRRRAFFNGPCVFVLPEGREQDSIELDLVAPTDAACADWRVATAMRPVEVDPRGFGRYCAGDYDELIDHPFEIGSFQQVTFDAAGVPHRFVVAGRVATDLQRVAADLAKVCATQIGFFGAPAPFDSYLFLGLAVGEGHGGLEHRASSSLVFRRDDLPAPGDPAISAAYRRFLGLASHEYFHSWHIKRTKPAAFMPYRLDRRNHTRLLWVFEGITSYYQERMLLKSGLHSASAYLKRVAEQLTRVYRSPGRFKQSIADASYDAWDILYKPEANSPNSSVSYYSKGALAALALDLHLRGQNSTVTLDDIVRELWLRYGAKGIGVPERGFEELARELFGADLDEFFDTAVRGTEDLPLADLLAACGVRMQLQPAQGPADLGGQAALDDGERLSLGVAYRAGQQGLELMTVYNGGAAELAGLDPGDVLIAIDGFKVNEQNLKQRLGRYEAAATLPVTVFRGDELLSFSLTLQEAVLDTCFLELDAAATGPALERRKAWLGE
jgi:predicted metalloprotease with PDZ domain